MMQILSSARSLFVMQLGIHLYSFSGNVLLLSETALAEAKWRTLRPLVPAILNRTANAAFDGLLPVEIQLARKVAIQLDTVASAGLSTEEQTTLEGVSQVVEVRAAFDAAAAAVQGFHHFLSSGWGRGLLDKKGIEACCVEGAHSRGGSQSISE